MFGKFMNNYYYGKSGQGDYNPEDLPKTRWQLFMEMLRTRLSALSRLNLLYVLPWLPMIVVMVIFFSSTMSIINDPAIVSETIRLVNTGTEQPDGSVVIPAQTEGAEPQVYSKAQIEELYVRQAAYAVDDELVQINSGTLLEDGTVSVALADGTTRIYTAEEISALQAQDEADTAAGMLNMGDSLRSMLLMCMILLIPCIFITGPWTAGVSYVTRNWARDEHAFLWSDCKDAMKENWKASLVLSGITSVVPFFVYLCWTFYGQPVEGTGMIILMQLGQMIPVMVAIIWYLAITYAYPMLVTYKMSIKTVIRNSLILAVGRLPMSVGIRLLHCVPVALGVVLMLVINSIWVPLLLLAYYVLFGFAFSRFITASYTNAQFDKFINSRIEGAQVNRGLAEEDDEDYEDYAEEEERELKPWENGYADRRVSDPVKTDEQEQA